MLLGEISLAFTLTFVEPFKKRPFQLKGKGWVGDPHLRFGYFTALPIFLILGLASGVAPSPFDEILLIGGSLLANLAWFTISGLSRRRMGST